MAPRTTRLLYAGTAADIGGKASALSALAAASLPIPAWFVVSAGDVASDALPLELDRALATLAPLGELLAVRSSAVEEDSAAHSFAGQYESFLFVAPADVAARIRDLWSGAASDRVAAYRRERGLTGPAPLPAALVQRMVNPDVAGVAFSADPVSGRRGLCVVAATYGVGTAIVSGDADADSYYVERDGTISSRMIADKRRAHRRAIGDADGASEFGVLEETVPEAMATVPALTDAQCREVAALARATERHFGRPQDIEWAIENGSLYLLQSRPITSLASLPDPDGEVILWDNSNIVESYGGITTPLTFSFARYVYENVYREFCRILRVSRSRIEANEDALRTMLGLVQGRVYYNLVSWYRILALLPGYQVNRAFMEQMMGVSEGLPAEIAARIAAPPPHWRARAADALSLLRTLAALIRGHLGMNASIAAFRYRLDTAMASGGDLSAKRPDELVAHFRALERALLTRWDAPLLNDFLAMIFYGVLRKLSTTWCGDTNGTLQNDLVSGDGTVVSAEPARRIVDMAAVAARDVALTAALCEGDAATVRQTIASNPELQRAFTDYLARFGDRCLEELKLETLTLDDDPMLLARSVGRVARTRAAQSASASAAEGAAASTATSAIASDPVAHAGAAPATPSHADLRGDAERRAFAAIGANPVRRVVFRWVLRHARSRIRDRENLRFERTRVFGRVRRIVVELSYRYAALDRLDDPRDVFYLTIDEALGWPAAESSSGDLRALAKARQAEFARYRELPAPPDRFITRGVVPVGASIATSTPLSVAKRDTNASAQGIDPATERRGTGCYPGVVRGPVRVVRDPRSAVLEPGEILVAERTDPGWVMLFPAASGLLVERGSLLSHSAIVARELALPAVVSIAGLTSWLNSGDVVEFDGRTGVVRRLETRPAP